MLFVLKVLAVVECWQQWWVMSMTAAQATVENEKANFNQNGATLFFYHFVCEWKINIEVCVCFVFGVQRPMKKNGNSMFSLMIAG